MMSRRWVPPVITGTCRFDSAMFSNRWRLTTHDGTLAELHRSPSNHTSTAALTDGTRIDLVPNGWGTIEAIVDGEVLSRIDRRSWWGRRWEISGSGFGCDLTSDPLPRRWTFRLGGAPIGRLAGTIWSYNRLNVEADVSIPVHAVVLAWHVLARPWEQAAAPGSLVPHRST